MLDGVGFVLVLCSVRVVVMSVSSPSIDGGVFDERLLFDPRHILPFHDDDGSQLCGRGGCPLWLVAFLLPSGEEVQVVVPMDSDELETVRSYGRMHGCADALLSARLDEVRVVPLFRPAGWRCYGTVACRISCAGLHWWCE